MATYWGWRRFHAAVRQLRYLGWSLVVVGFVLGDPWAFWPGVSMAVFAAWAWLIPEAVGVYRWLQLRRRGQWPPSCDSSAEGQQSDR